MSNILHFTTDRERALRAILRMLRMGTLSYGKTQQLAGLIDPNCQCKGCRKFFGNARPSNEIIADLLPGIDSSQIAKIPNNVIVTE